MEMKSGTLGEPVPDERRFMRAVVIHDDVHVEPARNFRLNQIEEFAKLLGCLMEANQGWAKAAPVLMISVAKRTFDYNGKPNRCAVASP